MAYNVYFACDNCGTEGGAMCNRTVSLAKATTIARKLGWCVGKRGWICPNCKAKTNKAGRSKGK